MMKMLVFYWWVRNFWVGKEVPLLPLSPPLHLVLFCCLFLNKENTEPSCAMTTIDMVVVIVICRNMIQGNWRDWLQFQLQVGQFATTVAQNKNKLFPSSITERIQQSPRRAEYQRYAGSCSFVTHLLDLSHAWHRDTHHIRHKPWTCLKWDNKYRNQSVDGHPF